MMATSTCPSCCKKYAGFGGDDARKPAIFTCLCVFCKGCALKEEAIAQQQQQPAASGGGGKKGKGKKKKKKGEEEKAEYTPTPCMSCSKHCTVPVNELKLDVAAMKEVDGGGAHDHTELPLCAMCASEQATTFCKDCASNNRFTCDGCHAIMHKAAKKKGHVSIPIQEHLASGSRAVGGGAAAGVSKMCSVHIGHPLLLFCDTCNMLICAMCAAFDHAGHIYNEVKAAIVAHRSMVEAAVAAVKITRQEVIAATTAIKIIRGELEGNRDAAIKLIDAGFNKLLRAIKQRRDALKKMVNDVYDDKDDALNKQITELEGIDTHSENALKLVEATLEAASPIELLERKQLFVDGLTQLKEHGASLKEECRSTISAMVDVSFEQQAADILAVGWISREDTDPTASTAAGEGLTVARVGEAAEFVVTAVDTGTVKQRSSGGDVVVVLFVHKGAPDESGGGGGGAAAAAAKPEGGKRKRSGGGSSGKGRAPKKSKTGAAASPAPPANATTVVDNSDGTYSCSYTPPEGADAVGGGKWRLEVLLNGKHIVGSPFAIEVRPSATMTNWAFGSIAAGDYALSEGGTVANKIIKAHSGAIVDGAGCTPMASGVNYWELEVVNVGSDNGYWIFGVCRPGIDLNDGVNFYSRADTWLVGQDNGPGWDLCCTTCEGSGMTMDPEPNLPAGSRIGLLLDLDNGGTLTMYLEGKPCGTIAEGLVGPLLPCITSYDKEKVVKIHGGLAPPPQ